MTTHRWTIRDLETYQDGEFPPDLAARLEADLLRDRALRARLDAVRCADDLTALALATPSTAAATRFPLRACVLLTAAILLLVGGAATLRVLRPTVTPIPTPPPVTIADAQLRPTSPKPIQEPALPTSPMQPEYSPIRVVLSVPVPHDADLTPAPIALPDDPIEPAPPSLSDRVALALELGDADAAACALSDADGPERTAALRRMGQLLNSAAAADRVLDSLSPAEQVAACRVWAADTHLRGIVFPRLRTLGESPDLAAELRAAVDELSQYRELRPWLRSYGLAAPTSPPVPPARTRATGQT